ncbi:MAG TPA: hypothetical protein VMZ91_04995 [Candidatus Paceibacterota bacterium]|nr:hypothetical protein [Candidatus Paceibacterota bacterium]
MKKYIKKCVNCEEEFTCENNRRLYCSKKCKRKSSYQRNKERDNRVSRLYKKNHRNEINKYKKKYRWDNIEREREKERKYLNKHRKKISANIVKRRKESLTRKISHSMSSSVLSSLKFKGISKNGRHWENIVGWTKEDLKKHIENLFREGMNWDNYGEWHIDHIIPKAFFKFKNTNDVEFKMCWRLDNLQPLWAKDNVSKQSKIVLWGKNISVKV